MTSRLPLALGSLLTAACLTALPGPLAGTASAADGPTVRNGCIKSVPEPGTTDPVSICYSLFKPAGASRADKVPLVMHSHGWGGQRTTDPAAFDRWLEAGYGVLSFDQRGFGESGGQAHVENPRFEGHDVRRLVRLVSNQRWVRKDGRRDPRLGAIGGSYGGGYQYLGAFEHLRTRGRPVFDALAPEITWFDLKQSLAPEEVVRTEWAVALSAAAATTDALPPKVYKALVEGAATGMWPDGSVPGTENLDRFFRKNGPRWHVRNGRKLDIPVLMGQGTTDTLFNLQQGLATWRNALTRQAKQESIFVGYNGGHVLPQVVPPGVNVTSDPFSKKLGSCTFADLALRFMNEHLKGRTTGLKGYDAFHLATPDSTCTSVRSVKPDRKFRLGPVATLEGASAPIAYPVAEGPIRIAGNAYVTGKLTALGVNNRAFYGLGIGTSRADAHLVQNNVLPINELGPVDREPRRIQLPAVAVDVPRGQRLFLIVSAVSDTFGGMGSRTPGAVVLQNTVAHLPVVGR